MTPQQYYDPETGEPIEQGGLALWQKLALAASLVLGIVGVVLGSGGASQSPDSGTTTTIATAPDPDQPQPEGFVADPNAPQPEGFVAGTGAGGTGPSDGGPGGGGPTIEEDPTKTVWAPLLAKGGLSFFVAFCIGYAMRAALKVTMLGIGVLALAVFGLQYAGVIGEIDWSKAQQFWDDLTANLGEQFETAKDFVASSLPSAASAAVGLIAGFQRKG